MNVERQTARVFFALWPDEAVRRALARAGRELEALCGGRCTRPEAVHITLVFLGEVEIARLAELSASVAGIRAPSFTLTLDRLGYWRHNRIAWAAPTQIPPPVVQLADDVRAALRGAGFSFDAKPCWPHATLLRHADCRAAQLPACRIDWQGGEFVLVRSVPGPAGQEYEVIGRWPLSPPAL